MDEEKRQELSDRNRQKNEESEKGLEIKGGGNS